MRILSILLGALALYSCSHAHKTSHEARQALQEEWEEEIGEATKEDLRDEFGDPRWCKLKEGGIEECNFYRSFPKVEIGEGFEKRTYVPFDELTTTFGPNKKLQSVKVLSVR